MRKSVALLLVLIFLTASCVSVVSPAESSVGATENSWASKASMPQGKNGGLVVADGKIYSIGGTIENHVTNINGFSGVNEVVNTNYEYDPARDRWTIKPPIPTPRYGFAAVVYKNSIYCIGGVYYVRNPPYSTQPFLKAAVEVFNISTNKWENKTPMPTRMSDIATIVYEDNIYCIGRWTNEVYNIAADTWQTKAPMPFNGSIITANVVNGKLYLTSDSLMYVYNPAMDSWTTKSPIQTERYRYTTASAVVDNKIYVISANLTQIYDTETNTVSLGASPPPEYIGGWALTTTGEMAPKRIYLLYESLQVYNPEADSWVIGAKIPTSPSGFALVNDKIYAIGGVISTITSYHQSEYYPYDRIPDVSVTQLAATVEYTPFGYDTVPPRISLISPENQNYNVSSVSLAFTVNRPVVWMGYSLDGGESVTITGNITLSGLSNGLHNVTVYAKDEFENTGASETVSFSVDEPFPVVPVAAASVATIAVVGVGLLVYFKKRKR